MKHREKHETNGNSQLTPVTSPRATWPMEGERGASGASTFHSRARIYRDFHPAGQLLYHCLKKLKTFVISLFFRTFAAVN